MRDTEVWTLAWCTWWGSGAVCTLGRTPSSLPSCNLDSPLQPAQLAVTVQELAVNARELLVIV